MMDKKGSLTGKDLFSGAGGLGLGVSMAGAKVRHPVEQCIYAAQTYSYNHKEVKVSCEDIQNVADSGFLQADEDIFVVMGNLPRQGFFVSDARLHNMNNPKNLLFKEFVRIVKEVKPKWFVLKSVWGMTPKKIIL